MKLGCHTLQWGMAIDKKDRYTWDGTERGITLSEVLRDIAKLKFAGFECTDNDVGVYSADVQGFRRAVKKSGVEFVSTWSTVFPKKLPATFRSVVNTSLPMSDPSQYLPISVRKIDKSKTKSEVERQVDYARLVFRMGARLLTVGGPYMAREHVRDGDYATLGEALNEFGGELEKMGMRMAYHPEVGTPVTTSEDVDRLFDHADRNLVHLCLETAHLTAAGDDPVKFVNKYTDRIIHAHFKDLADGLFGELGTGVVDFKGIVRALNGFGYDGWVMSELDFPRDTPYESAVRNKRYLDNLMKGR